MLDDALLAIHEAAYAEFMKTIWEYCSQECWGYRDAVGILLIFHQMPGTSHE
jgi:hypothetical protein